MSKNIQYPVPNTILKDEDVNLIDLKKGTSFNVPGDDDDNVDDTLNFDFNDLKYIERPIEENSVDRLPQTLEDCVGYLSYLPLLQPNADQNDPQSVVDRINKNMKMSSATNNSSSDVTGIQKKKNHSRAVANLGHTVRPGCISFYIKYGAIYAVPEGQWWLLNPMAMWIWGMKNVSLDQNLIETADSQVLIIRIIEGQIGLITIQGVHHLLDVGTHVFNTGTVKFLRAVNYAKINYFEHGPFHYLQVPRGKIAKVWVEVIDSNQNKTLIPRLIEEGEHFIKSPSFLFDGLCDISDEYIGHFSIHILNVQKGRIAKAFCDNLPRLFGEGLHIIESPNFKYCGFEQIVADDFCISHGTITIIQVNRGKIALTWNNSEPLLLDEPGLYEFNSNDVHFVKFVNASERYVDLGSKKVIHVYTGEVGITYDRGELKILENGRHVISSSDHVFQRFLSTKQRSIRLITYGANQKISKSTQMTKKIDLADDSDLLVCETRDLVKVGVRADVFYSIVDPTKCIQTLNTDELEDLVRETAVATLTNIIRSTALNQIAQSRQISAGSGETAMVAENVVEVNATDSTDVTDLDKQEAVSFFFDRAHDEFMLKLHEDFVTRYGVDITNIRMESFKIMNNELANEISQHCLTTAHVENQLSNLQGESLIATQKEQTAADCEKIKALAEAAALETLADAENKRNIEAAKADAEAKKLKVIAEAQAEADAILLKAKADAEAIRLKAKAESERAKLLSLTPLGKQQCLFEIYSDMVKKSNEGVEKIVYLDPSVNKDSPFALGSLDGLNRDLHAMSQLGIASKES